MTTVTEILEQLRVPRAHPGHKNVRHGWIGIECPFCGGGDGKFLLGIHPETGAVNCWRCGRKSLWAVIHAITGNPKEASALLGDVRLRRGLRQKVSNRHTCLPTGLGDLMPIHQSYLRERGLDAELAQDVWHARGIGMASRLAWRIWIPIEIDGVVVSWTTRSVSQTSPRRYISARPDEESVPIKDTLYGEDYCRNAIIVHEGPLDVWRTGPGSTCTYGLSYTDAQVAKISRYPIRVIAFDDGFDARRAADGLARDLSAFAGDTFVVAMETGEDPGSADPEETAELRRTFLDFD